MGPTENKAFLTLDDTILSYSGNDVTLVIPDALEGRPVRAIGKGAMSESAALRRVVVPKEIRRIGEHAFDRCEKLEYVEFGGALPRMENRAFAQCPRLKELSLPRMPLPGERLCLLRENSCRLPDGCLVPERIPEWDGMDLLGVALDTLPFCYLPKTAGLVFPDADDAPAPQAEEARRFLELIRNGVETPRIREAEEANDLSVRREFVPEIKPVALLCVDDRKAEDGEKDLLLPARILLGCFFWQSKVRILCDRQTYYLYQRNYLTGNEEMGYIRRNVCVFTEEGPLRNERRAREIYAKYQLSSIL